MESSSSKKREFSGNIFIFHAFDIGEDIDLDKIRREEPTLIRPLHLSKYFKGYHTPIAVDLPHPHDSGKFESCTLHHFGVVSLAYKIPFEATFEEIRNELPELDNEFLEQSVSDAASIFKKIKFAVKHPKFFHLRTSYVVIQVDQQPQELSLQNLRNDYGAEIASMLRFETEHLSEEQKNEILSNDLGYYRGDLIFIDSFAAFLYDDEYEDILDLFEFSNIQLLELQYFDRMLDQQLNVVYQQDLRKLPLISYLPFIGSLPKDPIARLSVLRVEISVITERLKRSIKIAGEDFVAEIYDNLVAKLELTQWKQAIDDKLDIIQDLNEIYQHKLDTRREELLTVLIIILIFVELLVALFKG